MTDDRPDPVPLDQRPLDQLAEYLDGDASAAEQIDLSGVPREELARHLLVAGAVQHLLGESQVATRQTVRNGMAAISHDEWLSARARRRNRIFGTLAAAAAVMVTALILWWEPPGLQPVLNRMHQFVTADVDRRYDVEFEFGPQTVQLLPIKIEVALRGTHSFFASVRPQLAGGRSSELDLRQGFDGEEYWVMFPDVAGVLGNMFGRDNQAQGDTRPPVIVSRDGLAECFGANDLGALAQLGRGLDRMEIGLRMFQLLDELERRYQVRPGDDDDRQRFEVGPGQTVLIATRQAQTPPTFPETIGILLDEASGTIDEFYVRYLELPEIMSSGNPFRRIRFKLSPEQFPRPDDFYSHAAHHAPDHPIRYAK